MRLDIPAFRAAFPECSTLADVQVRLAFNLARLLLGCAEGDPDLPGGSGSGEDPSGPETPATPAPPATTTPAPGAWEDSAASETPDTPGDPESPGNPAPPDEPESPDWLGGLTPRQTLLCLLAAHIGILAQRPAHAPGTITSSSQGSVSVSFALPNAPGAGWYAQTQYGLLFWQATARLRLGRYYA